MYSHTEGYIPSIDTELKQQFDLGIKKANIIFNVYLENPDSEAVQVEDVIVHTVGMRKLGHPEIVIFAGPKKGENPFNEEGVDSIIQPLVNSLTFEGMINIIEQKPIFFSVGTPYRRFYQQVIGLPEQSLEHLKLARLKDLTGYYETTEYDFILYHPNRWDH